MHESAGIQWNYFRRQRTKIHLPVDDLIEVLVESGDDWTGAQTNPQRPPGKVESSIEPFHSLLLCNGVSEGKLVTPLDGISAESRARGGRQGRRCGNSGSCQGIDFTWIIHQARGRITVVFIDIRVTS